jgi:hypothetical protein
MFFFLFLNGVPAVATVLKERVCLFSTSVTVFVVVCALF